ncbi:MAG: LuxR C-terminal-related transcriptional regulator [Muribaculaceae bacterium]|nr:LuxR C-terminal-related transcriptional regulator [Muribaculaceae bacterium]
MTEVVIIMPDTMMANGVRYLLAKYLDIEAGIYASVSEYLSNGMQSTAYITDAATLAGNVDFFLPRRKRTMLVGSAQVGTDMEFVSSHQPVSDIVDALDRFLSACASPPPDTLRTELSTREIQVLRLIAAGCINKEIADRLGISLNTVLSHRKNIVSKLGIRSTSGLSIFAMMNGIIEPPSNY